MERKFKEGDYVQVLDTPNVRVYRKEAIGFKFLITNKEMYPARSGDNKGDNTVYLDKDNKYSTNYIASDLKLLKSGNMATKKKSTITLKDGQYYTACVNRKKIRGIVYENSYNNTFYLLNNQEVGDGFEDFKDDCEFNHGVAIDVYYEDTHDEALKASNVTQFTVVTDRRIKKVIDNDILPEIEGYRVRKTDKGYKFGCGAVKLTIEQIKAFIRYETKKRALSDDKDYSVWKDVSEEIRYEDSIESENVNLEDAQLLVDNF